MQALDDIILSASEWRAFERDINIPNPERARRAEAFLTQFDGVVTARRSDEGMELDIPWLEDEEVSNGIDVELTERVAFCLSINVSGVRFSEDALRLVREKMPGPLMRSYQEITSGEQPVTSKWQDTRLEIRVRGRLIDSDQQSTYELTEPIVA